MDATFWQGRRVFLTGHTGFKGGWLALWLGRLGAEVTGFALAPDSEPSFFEATALGGRMTSILGDIRDAGVLAAAMEEARPEVVFHLAAQALVRRAHADPVGTWSSNVMGTVHVLDAVRRVPGVLAVVVVTSDKVYDDGRGIRAYAEDDRLGGREPYGTSKAASEMVIEAYRQSYLAAASVGVATARAGNVIGGGDWAADRLVPDAARAFAAGDTLSIRNPDAVRPWQYVLDPLRGYLMLAERLYRDTVAAGGAWNFGPGDEGERSVARVVGDLARLWGGGAGWQVDAGSHPYEAAHLAVDSGKAQRHLGWRPLTTFDETLAATVAWYRAHGRGEDMGRFSLACIGDFGDGR